MTPHLRGLLVRAVEALQNTRFEFTSDARIARAVAADIRIELAIAQREEEIQQQHEQLHAEAMKHLPPSARYTDERPDAFELKVGIKYLMDHMRPGEKTLGDTLIRLVNESIERHNP